MTRPTRPKRRAASDDRRRPNQNPSRLPLPPQTLSETMLGHLVDRLDRHEEKLASQDNRHADVLAKLATLDQKLNEQVNRWWMSWLEPAKPHAWKIATATAGLIVHRLATGSWPSVPDFAAFVRMLITGG